MNLATTVSTRSRTRKFDLFMRMLEPSEKDWVLDVGVDPGGANVLGDGIASNFFEALYPWPGQLVALGLGDGRGFCHAYPGVQYRQGNGLALPFAANSFDIVFSNAVIEHVGSWEDQVQFANEIRRVGLRYFVTTPNRWFPVETHTRLPLVHWLPSRPRAAIYRRAGKPWAVEGQRLLAPSDMHELFPEAKVVNLGMTIVAVKR